jgi:GT2 family glycosyltransferase
MTPADKTEDASAPMDETPPKPSAGTEPPKKGVAAAGPDESSEVAPEEFDELAYLAAFPDIARSIRTGQFRSALHHYRVHGQREGRLTDVRYQRASVKGNTSSFPPASIDGLQGCKAGLCLIYGWIKDNNGPIAQLTLRNNFGLWGTTQTVYRYRRKDAADSLGLTDDRPLGFWAIVNVEKPESMFGQSELVVSAGHERKTFNCQVRSVSEERFREIALEYIARAQHPGDARVETFLQLDNGLGKLLIDFNLEISRRIALGAQTLQIGTAPSSIEASIVVCLFGRPELLSLQCALFSKCRGIDRYEFIYVLNSPEIADRLIKDATIASRVYGIPIRLVILPGNAGFGVANNAAANVARSDRILFVNPDVFPVEPDWPSQHSQLVKNMPPEQVAFFGVPLFYDDGSLMHGGMYFEMDLGFSFRDNKTTVREMLRVEHYGKGVPPTTKAYLASRPVPAVTGAFMSVDRSWFEGLGGFAPEYIFGHYEDADLCLKSLRAGKPVWIHYLPFLHFEGKGSTPRTALEGGTLVNRWHFTAVWTEFVKTGLRGKNPESIFLRGQQ